MRARLFAVGVTVAIMAFVAAQSVGAQGKPLREAGTPFDATFPAGLVCSFDLSVSTLKDNQHLKTFFDKDGNPTRQQAEGSLTVQAENTDTGKALVLNVSGPGTLYFRADGTIEGVGGGPSVWLFFATDVGGARAILTTGYTDFIVDQNGNFTSFVHHGSTTDLCAALS